MATQRYRALQAVLLRTTSSFSFDFLALLVTYISSFLDFLYWERQSKTEGTF